MSKRPSSSSGERRNFYRILNVQPDAPLGVIRNNYRTLMQKLKLHPDLGGDLQQASMINEAYQVLSDAHRRAIYDKELLAEYGMEILSRGNLKPDSAGGIKPAVANSDDHGNQRNYYRVLNVSPDAPENIIKTSYLSQKKNGDNALLNEAYTVLGNPDKRKLYDRLLARYHHADAVDLLHNKMIKDARNNGNSVITHMPLRLRNTYGKSEHHTYKPVITQYCAFCKTPHKQSPCEDTAPLCIVCNSPLFPPSTAFLEQNRRDIVRLAQRNGECNAYLTWPGRKHRVIIGDLSPLGMQIQADIRLERNQLIKLDGENFKAVGRVKHSRNEFDGENFSQHIYGIKFLTVNFNKLKGQFFSASA